MIANRRLAVVAVWTLPSLVFFVVTAVVYGGFSIQPPARLDEAARSDVMASLRAALDDRAAVPCTSGAPIDGIVAVTVWSNGAVLERVDGLGDRLGSAIDEAAAALRAKPSVRALSADARNQARLQVDVVVGSAPLIGGALLDAVTIPEITGIAAVNPGVDGVGARAGSVTTVVLPHELVLNDGLVARSAFAIDAPTKRAGAHGPTSLLPDFATGINADVVTKVIANRGGSTDPTTWFRFRTDSFIERPAAQRPGAPLQLVRGNTAGPALSAKTLREAALAGGRYLVDHLGSNGRYIYEVDLSTGKPPVGPGGSYSMPRHAGTTYFLAELYRITREPWLREPVERAFAHLAELMSSGRCAATLPDGSEIDCVLDKSESTASLGSTALTVVALAEYQRATGDQRYLAMTKKLARFLLYMQRPDGSFRHRYNPTTKTPNETDQLLYYSGEASLALARMHVITGDPMYAKAAQAGLDWLVDWYDFFVGGFLYGEEHWTCIAAEAIWPAVKNPRYREFCHGYGAFLRDQQASSGERPDHEDLAGSYQPTPFVMPSNTPAGSRSEAMISAYFLGRYHGAPDVRVRRQVVAALQYLLGQQIRPDYDFN
ncbi:MAG: hypothetical protein AB7O24_20830, partial [Kofleriaceae bacterium]